MNKFILLIFHIVLLVTFFFEANTSQAQYPRLSIKQIQEVPIGRDSSIYAGDTVITGGLVTSGTGVFYAGTGYSFYIEDPDGGPFSGINAYYPTTTGFPSLIPGDSILCTAMVVEYVSTGPPFVTMTELFIVPGTFQFRLYGMPEPEPMSILAAEIDSAGNADLAAEKYEGVFVKIEGLTVDSVINYTSTSTWICHDSSGTCYIREASDSIPNSFRPSVGTTLDFVQGVIYHRFGAYHLQPRYRRDISDSAGAPVIGSVHNVPQFPIVGEPVTISANVYDDGDVDTVKVYYRINLGGWTGVPMIYQGSNLHTFQLPSPVPGWQIDYYIYAVDELGLVNRSPYEAPLSFFEYEVCTQSCFGVIEGYVTDWASAPLGNVLVNVDGILIKDTSDASGYYSFARVYSGLHNLSYSLSGYRDTTISGVNVVSGDSIMVNTVLFDSETGFGPYYIVLSPLFDSTSAGGSTNYILSMTNGNMLSDNFSVNIVGLDSSWYQLSDVDIDLLSGQSLEDTIFVNVPVQAGIQGDYPFEVNVYISDLDSTITRSATLRVVNNPIITSVSPPDSMRTSSREVDFSWYTSAICSTEVYIKPSDSSSYTVYVGPLDRNHTVTVTGLARNQMYDWYVRSAGDWGGVSTGPVRQFFIENGIVFTLESYTATVNRDYNQRFVVGITNTDSIAHSVWLEADSLYSDIAINFVGDGSVDNRLLLNPGQTAPCTLAAHLQDAVLTDYIIPLKLTSAEGTDTIVDYATANIHVNIPVVSGTFEEYAPPDSGTLAKNYRFTNLGDPITDLNIIASESLDARIYFEPQISHGYLATGQSIDFKAIPVLSPADTSENPRLRAEGNGISYPREDLITVAGSITANFMGASISQDANFVAPPGEHIFLGNVDGIYRCFNKRDWYCTNKPDLRIPWRIPPMEAPNQAFFQLSLTPSSGWQQRPHSVFVYVNDRLVGSIENVIPHGTYSFVVDPQFLNFSPNQVSINTVRIRTTHMNGGHYVVGTDMSICACLDELEGYVSAATQEQANQRLASLAGVTPPASNIVVDINLPLEGADINLGQATTIRATVTADGQPGRAYPVTATFNNGDQSLVMWDDGQHNDLSQGDGIYAGQWHPGHTGSCAIIVRAGNCEIFGQDNINVNIIGPSMLNITVNFPQNGFYFIKGRQYNITATVRDNFGNVVRGLVLDNHCINVNIDCQPGVSIQLTDLGTTGDGVWEDGVYGGYWTPDPESPGPCNLTFTASSPNLGSAEMSVGGTIIPMNLLLRGLEFTDDLYNIFADSIDIVVKLENVSEANISNLEIRAYDNGQLMPEFYWYRDLDHNGTIDYIAPGQDHVVIARKHMETNSWEDHQIRIEIAEIDGIPYGITSSENISCYYAKRSNSNPPEAYDIRKDSYSFQNRKYRFEEATFNCPLLPWDWYRYVAGMLTAKGGACFGMAASSYWYFMDPERKPIMGVETFDYLETDENVLPYIMVYMAGQARNYKNILVVYFPPAEQERALKEYLIDGKPVLAQLAEQNPEPWSLQISFVHAVNAFKLIRDNTTSQSYAHIYENNANSHPNIIDERIVKIGHFDLTTRDGLFDYNGYTGVEFLEPWTFAGDGCSYQTILGENVIHNISDLGRHDLQLFRISCPVRALAVDDYGNRIGFVTNDSLIKEIPGSDVIFEQGQFGDTSISFLLPLLGSYHFNIWPLSAGEVSVYSFKPTGDSTCIFSSFDSIQISQNSRLNITLSERGYDSLLIDMDNNGSPDSILPPNSNLSPMPVMIYSPQENVYMEDPVSFVWSSSYDVDFNDSVFYRIILYTSPDFSDPDSSILIQDTLFTWPSNLIPGAHYYTKVIAVDTKGGYTLNLDGMRAFHMGGGCYYIPGDINGNGQANGIDVVYGVSYLKGGAAPPDSCDCPPMAFPFYAAGDVNGNCAFNGIDITYYVSYLKGIQPALLFCADCPPAGGAVVSKQIEGKGVPNKIISEPVQDRQPEVPIQRPVLKPRDQTKTSD